MLYVKALRSGLADLPQADAALRSRIDAEAAERSWPALHAELAQMDPETAARLKPTDTQRIQRAVEVLRLTGQMCIRDSDQASLAKHDEEKDRVNPCAILREEHGEILVDVQDDVDELGEKFHLSLIHI